MRNRHGARQPLTRVFSAGLCLLGLCSALAACVDSGGGDFLIVHPTIIAVAPEDFRGSVVCIDAPGALRRYVVTLHDVTDEGAPFTLPSSGPLDCALEARFGFVVPGNKYVARVDGYDRADIRPLGPPDIANSGNPVMVDTATGEYVPPRWTSTCTGPPADDLEPETGGEDSGETLEQASDASAPDAGDPDAGPPSSCEIDPDPLAGRDRAVTSIRFLTRRVQSCTPLCDRVGPGVTGLSVSIDRALGTLQCGNGPGQVASFRVEREGSSASAETAACEQAVTFTLDPEPRQSVTFRVSAFENGRSEPSWATKCYGTPALGTVLPASCDPLVSTGAAPKTDL